MKYGFSKTTDYNFEQAIEKVTEELKKEGFGVLTTIDVKDTFKKRIDVEFKNYTILGACNPRFAHNGLQIEEELGLLLPCNVIVYEKNNKTVVSVFDPMIMTVIVDSVELKSVAEEVKLKLERVIKAL